MSKIFRTQLAPTEKAVLAIALLERIIAKLTERGVFSEEDVNAMLQEVADILGGESAKISQDVATRVRKSIDV